MAKIKFGTKHDINRIVSCFGKSFDTVTRLNEYPAIGEIEIDDRILFEKLSGSEYAEYEIITKGDYYLVNDGSYIYMDPDINEKENLERYIRNFDEAARKSDDNMPHGVTKKIARVASRFDLDLSVIDRFMLKKAKVHASYNRKLNAFRIVPEYFLRFGVINTGGNFVDEFTKTFVHEYGHAIWHQLLDSRKIKEYLELIPKYSEKEFEGSTKGKTTSLDGMVGEAKVYTPKDAPFVSQYARFDPKEDFSESFAYYKIAPEFLKTVDPGRYDFFDKIQPLFHKDKLEKNTKIKNVGTKSRIELSGLVPVDLQTSEKRAKLAAEFENNLINFLEENSIDKNKIRNITFTGAYTTSKEEPKKIDANVFVHTDEITNQQRIVNDNIDIVVTPHKEDVDFITYEDIKNKKNMISKRQLKPEEIDRWVTVRGRRIPIPKKGTFTGLKSRKKKTGGDKMKSIGSKTSRKQTNVSLHRFQGERQGVRHIFSVGVNGHVNSFDIPGGLPRFSNERKVVRSAGKRNPAMLHYEGRFKYGKDKGVIDIRDRKGADVLSWGKDVRSFRIYSGPNKGSYKMSRVPKTENWIMRRTETDRPPISKIKPIRFQRKFSEHMMKDKNFVIQPDIGGIRTHLHLDNVENRIVTTKKMNEKTDHFPHLRDLKLGMSGTVLEGKVFVKDRSNTNKMINASAITSRNIQEEIGKPIFIASDILRYNGVDVSKKPYSKRLEMLEETVPDSPYIKVIPSFKKNKESYVKEMNKLGWKGIMVKDLREKYGHRLGTRVKGFEAKEYYVTGVVKSKRYPDRIASLKISEKKNGKMVNVGKVSAGFKVSDKRWLRDNAKSLIDSGAKIQVRTSGLSSKGKLKDSIFLGIVE